MANNVLKTSFGDIDTSTSPIYASQFGDGSTYGLNLSVNGQDYKYVPSNVVQNGGVTAGDNTNLLPWLANQDNLKTFAKNASPVDLSDVDFADALKSLGLDTNGYLVKADAVPFDSQLWTQSTSTLGGSLNGLKNAGGQIVYGITGGAGNRYLTTSGEVHNPSTHYSSLLGDWLGGAGQDIANAWNDLGPIGQLAVAYYAGGAIGDSLGGAAAGEGAAAAPAADFSGALPAGAEYVAPEVTTLGNVAGSTEGMAGAEAANAAQGLQVSQGAGTNLVTSAGNLAEMGGAQGLASGTTLANLADMGGAQGATMSLAALPLVGAMDAGTTAAGTLGAEGIGGAITPAAAGVGTNLGVGAGSAAADTNAALTAAGVGTGAAAGATGAAAGTSLADILPYTTGAGLLSGYLQSTAAKEAAQIQADAAAKALAQQQANFNTINAQQAPYRAAGYGALNQIANLGGGGTQQYDAAGNVIGTTTNPSDYLTHQFNAADLTAGLAPNYNFMLQQGQMANQRAANMSGGALGGNALQGLNKYTQDYAGNAYQNAFNNYQTQRSNIYNTLAGIAGIGQTGQTATNTAATNATNAASQLGVGSAAAQAAGTTGAANAYGNAINNATNYYTLASLLNQRGNVQMPV